MGRAGPLGANRFSWVVTHAHTMVSGFAAFEALPRLVRFPEIRAFVGRAGPLGAKRCSWVVTHAHTMVTGFAAFEALPRLVRFPEIRASWVEPDP